MRESTYRATADQTKYIVSESCCCWQAHFSQHTPAWSRTDQSLSLTRECSTVEQSSVYKSKLSVKTTSASKHKVLSSEMNIGHGLKDSWVISLHITIVNQYNLLINNITVLLHILNSLT